MDEMFAKLGGSWNSLKKDLDRDVEYEKACDRHPFIKAHLDPDLPSPRAGKPKVFWQQNPGMDIPKGPTPHGEAGGA